MNNDTFVIPGIRQDDLGQFYRIAVYNNLQLKEYCDPPPISEQSLEVMQPVIVHSAAYSAALDIVPQNEEQARKLKRILDAGPTYQSILFFQRGAS